MVCTHIFLYIQPTTPCYSDYEHATNRVKRASSTGARCTLARLDYQTLPHCWIVLVVTRMLSLISCMISVLFIWSNCISWHLSVVLASSFSLFAHAAPLPLGMLPVLDPPHSHGTNIQQVSMHVLQFCCDRHLNL